MKEFKITVMTPWEAIRPYIANKETREEYEEESELFREMNLVDDESIMLFLDNDAVDVRRLDEKECELFGLTYCEGWYINTWDNEYFVTL